MTESNLDMTRSKLESWIKTQWPNCSKVEIGAISVPKGGGNSAETSFVEANYVLDGQPQLRSLVLRRQIEGHDLFLYSDLNLPFQMMKAMAENSSVPVPRVIGIEFDRSLLGSPFLMMEAVEGRVVPQSPNYNVQGWVAELPIPSRAQVWRNAIETMAQIHQLDWQKGFTFLDRPEHGRPGLEQYINALEAWYRWALKGRDIPILETTMAYLRDRMPTDMPVCVLWGDSHAANILFRDDLSVSAVIDFEAAALGTPEIDFGYWLFFDELFSSGMGVTRLEGLPGLDEMIAWYEKALGRSVRDLKYFEIVAAMRFAIILLRFADRQVALGQIPPDSKAGAQNPATLILAAKLGVDAPGDISDWVASYRG